MNNEELNKAIDEAANDTPTTISMKSFKAGALYALTTESIYSKAGLVKIEAGRELKVACANCGCECKIVRPGKYQCPQCD